MDTTEIQNLENEYKKLDCLNEKFYSNEKKYLFVKIQLSLRCRPICRCWFVEK